MPIKIEEKQYQITFYNDAVMNKTLNLPAGILANLLRVLDMAKIEGPSLGRPHSAPLGNGLFEFRAKGKEGIARSVFVTLTNKEMVILHTVIKKSNTIPKKDMQLILQRAKEIK